MSCRACLGFAFAGPQKAGAEVVDVAANLSGLVEPGVSVYVATFVGLSGLSFPHHYHDCGPRYVLAHDDARSPYSFPPQLLGAVCAWSRFHASDPGATYAEGVFEPVFEYGASSEF